MSDEHSRFVAVYATGKRLYFDWACSALDDAGIPYFTRQYNVASLRQALPAFPTAEPGVSWTIWVPDNVAEAAQDEIDALPFDKDPVPGVWDFCSYLDTVRFWRVLILAVLILFLVPILSLL
jgi:hypothetical protein